MPFRLMDSGATFQRMMEIILANVNNVKCNVNDVFLHSSTKDRHIQHFETVMSLLCNHYLLLRMKESFFKQSQFELLDHFVDQCGGHVDGVKVETIRNGRCLRDNKALKYSWNSSHVIGVSSRNFS